MKLIISKDSFIDEKEIVIEPSDDDRYWLDGIIVAHRHGDGDLHISLKWLKKAISKLEAERREDERNNIFLKNETGGLVSCVKAVGNGCGVKKRTLETKQVT